MRPHLYAFPKLYQYSLQVFRWRTRVGEVHSLLRLLLRCRYFGDDVLPTSTDKLVRLYSRTESGSRTEFGVEPYVGSFERFVFGKSECFYTTAKPPYAEDSIVRFPLCWD